MPPTVSTAEFWRAVGEALLLHRVRLGLERHHVRLRGGPDGRTIEQIECGNPGHITKLQQLAQAYGLELTDLFRTVLSAESEPIAPEAHRLLRKYVTTTVEGRQALLAVVASLPDAPAPETLGSASESPAVPPGNTPRSGE
jgi:transcriptional regulator with XRE-family HTH domain